MSEKFRGSHLKSIWRTCNKIRAVLHQAEINLWGYFRSLDSNSSGLVSETKFLSIFAGKLCGILGLSEKEITELADYFKMRDGRIYYKQLCDVIQGSEIGDQPTDKHFVTGLEWEDPMHKNNLSPYEYRHVCLILAKIAQNIRLRDVALMPYFQDYELISNNHGTVTFAHFFRVLNFLGIGISKKDFHVLLIRYMKDSYTINYVAFVKDIEKNVRYFDSHRLIDNSQDFAQNYPGKLIDVQLPKLARPEIDNVNISHVMGRQTTCHPSVNSQFSDKYRNQMKIDEIVLRVKQHVLDNQIRVKEFFEKFDVFRCGFISKSQFKRGLDAIGVSGLHRLYLIHDEIETLCQLFADPNDPSRVSWKNFKSEIDRVFCEENLQCRPYVVVEVSEKSGIDKDDECVEQRGWQTCQKAIFKVNKTIQRRAVAIESLFKDFDRHNLGHVTKNQFYQVISRIGAVLTGHEILALESRYSDEMGFNYVRFMKEVDPQDRFISKYVEYIERKTLVNSERSSCPKENERNIVQILAKIKAQTVRKRTNIDQFMSGYDPMNHQSITYSEFKRGLSNANIILTENEMETVCDVFKSLSMPNYVDYKRFCEVIDEAFNQKRLERSPLIVPLQHFPSDDCPDNFLNFGERCVLSLVLQKLSRYHDLASNLSELFQNYDKTNCGTITQEQLLKAMTLRELHTLVSTKEMNVLHKCFSKRRGIQREFKYREFLQALELVANAGIQLPF